MSGLFDYIAGNTLLHRLDPRTKLLVAILFCIASFSASNIYMLLGMLALEMVIGKVGGIFSQTRKLLKGLFQISIFLFLLQVILIQKGEVLFSLPLGILVTEDGVMTAILVVLRLICATLPLALMLIVTKLSDLSNVLVARCHLTYSYAFAITSAIRFVPTFSTDMHAIMEAQTARGVEFDTKNPIKKIRLILPLCLPLLISSVKRIDSIAIATELRGFHHRTATSAYQVSRFHFRDCVVLLSSILLITFGILL